MHTSLFKNTTLHNSMFKKYFLPPLAFLFITIACIIPKNIHAQDPVDPNAESTPIETAAPAEIITLHAEAGKDQNAVIGRNVLFDASGTTVPVNMLVKYTWDFGDGTITEGVDATHIYIRPGVFRATLTAETINEKSTDDLIVSVEENLIILITDQSIKDHEVQKIYEYGLTQNILIVDVRDKSKDSDITVTKNLAQKLLLSQKDLTQAEIIISMTEGNRGLKALAELAQAVDAQNNESTTALNWKQKTIVVISSEPKGGVARIAQSTFNLLEPSRIILAKDAALFPTINAQITNSLLSTLQKQNVDYQIINQYSQRALDKLGPLNFMSYLLNYLINKGVDQNTILLILMLPVIATIITIARQIIGIKAFGIYIPSIIALTFVVTSLQFGIITFIALLITGTLTRIVAKRLRLLYLPRMAIVVTIVSFSILGMFTVAAYFDKPGFYSMSIFPILIMTILTERFVEAQIEKGAKTATKLTIESLILSIISYYIVTWDVLQNIILAYPETMLLVIILNLLLGRFTGLRLTEYLRFFNLLRHVDYDSKTKKNTRDE